MLRLLLKTPHILVVGYREFSLELTRKLSPWRLVLEGATGWVGGGRENTPVVLFRAGPCMLQYWQARQDVPSGSILAREFVGVANCSLDWIWGFLQRRHFLAGIIKQVKSPCLKKSQTLEEDLFMLPSFLSNIYVYIQRVMLLPTSVTEVSYYSR